MTGTTLILSIASGGVTLDRLLVLIRDWPAKRRYGQIMNERAEIENDLLRECVTRYHALGELPKELEPVIADFADTSIVRGRTRGPRRNGNGGRSLPRATRRSDTR
jgi:hypothetical protein